MKRIFIIVFLVSSLFLMTNCREEIKTRYTYGNSEEYKSGDCSFSSDEIKAIDVDWISGNVYIESDSSYQGITIHEVIDSNTSDEYRVHSYVEDGILMIKYCYSTPLLNVSFQSKELHIKVQSDLLFETVKCNMISSSIVIDNISSTIFHLDSISGNINAKNIKTESFEVETTSGNINLTSCEASKIDLFSTSGSMSLEKVNAESFNAETTSGDINLSNSVLSSLELKNTSGKSVIKLNSSPKEIEAKSVSGDLSFYLPSDCNFQVSYESISGNFLYNYDLTNKEDDTYFFGENASLEIDIETISGEVKIYDNN